MKNKTRETKKRSGFTLIELIVVLAILGILAAIAVPNFTAIQEDAKLKADAATANGILKAARLQHFADGLADNEEITALKDDYFDASDAQVQSKSVDKTYYLVKNTPIGKSTNYAVVWITSTGASDAVTGYIVTEKSNKHEELAGGATKTTTSAGDTAVITITSGVSYTVVDELKQTP